MAEKELSPSLYISVFVEKSHNVTYFLASHLAWVFNSLEKNIYTVEIKLSK